MNYRAEYERWLTEFASDAMVTAELRAISGDEKEIEDRFYTMLSFGTAGMRGVIGAGLNRMNVYNVRRATKALAKYIARDAEQARRGVAIAYDSRRFSDVFAKEAALTLNESGVKAYLFDALRPVPVLSFALRHLHAIAGIVITASHNPPAYNGYKVYWEDGGQMPPERADEIQSLIGETTYAESTPMAEAEAREKGLLSIIGGEVDDAYIAAVKKLCIHPALAKEMGQTLSIVYTPLHGSGNIPVRRILKEVGFERVYVVPEQELPDPDFSTVKVPNPEDPAAFTLALALQKKLGADCVFGTDPDCDRVGIATLDDAGEAHILTGNQIGCLLLHYILSEKQAQGRLPGNAAAVKSIVSTEMATAIASSFGAKMFDVLTGFKFIAEKIAEFERTGEYAFQFGFEESYGYLSGTDVRDKDGVNASMLIAETAAYYKKRGMTLYGAIRELYAKYGYFAEKTTSFALSGKEGIEKIQSIMRELRAHPPADFGGAKVIEVRDYAAGVGDMPPSDVLYYVLEDKSWVCVRPSGTEPKIKLYIGVVTDGMESSAARLESHAEAGIALLNAMK